MWFHLESIRIFYSSLWKRQIRYFHFSLKSGRTIHTSGPNTPQLLIPLAVPGTADGRKASLKAPQSHPRQSYLCNQRPNSQPTGQRFLFITASFISIPASLFSESLLENKVWYTSIPKIFPWQVLASHFLADTEIKCSLPVYFLLAVDMHILAELWKQFFSWEKNKERFQALS